MLVSYPALHPSWDPILRSEFEKPYMQTILRKLQTPGYCPPSDLVFKAFQETNFDQIRVVIIGQDPYHTTGLATGHAFAVNPATMKRLPSSLSKIFNEIDRGGGPEIDRTKTDLAGWVDQGVLLLNRILTATPGKPLSHKNWQWQVFTDVALNALIKDGPEKVFMLWGKPAGELAKHIPDRHEKLKATHPSFFSFDKGLPGEAFKECGHFVKANNWLRSRGRGEIDWTKV